MLIFELVVEFVQTRALMSFTKRAELDTQKFDLTCKISARLYSS